MGSPSLREKISRYYGNHNLLKENDGMMAIMGAVFIGVGALMIAKWIKDD